MERCVDPGHEPAMKTMDEPTEDCHSSTVADTGALEGHEQKLEFDGSHIAKALHYAKLDLDTGVEAYLHQLCVRCRQISMT
jgi:hypothetical protein